MMRLLSFFLRIEAAHCMGTFVPYETLAVHRQWMCVCVFEDFSFEIHPLGTMGTSMPWPCSFLLSLAKCSLIYFYSCPILFGKFVSCVCVFCKRTQDSATIVAVDFFFFVFLFNSLCRFVCAIPFHARISFSLLFATFRSVHKKIVVQLCNQHAREPYTQQLIAV